MTNTYSKTICFFCGKILSRNGLAMASHGRKHVREGIAEEIEYGHRDYRDCVEFIPAKRFKIGTHPAAVVIVHMSKYQIYKVGKKIKFKEPSDGSKWQNAIIKEIDGNCIFLELM